VGVVKMKRGDDIGFAIFALLAMLLFLGMAVFLALGFLDFVHNWRRASITDWVLFFPLVLVLLLKLLSPLRKYAQRKGWIPASIAYRLNAALSFQGQGPVGKIVIGAAMVCLVVAMFFESFRFWILFLALAYVGILADVVWAFVTASSRKPH
jgi:hypothetical protein